MSAPRYANVHILHPLPFSNPNRDDTGAPKTCVLGGTIRGRMSSQADKRPSRVAFEADSEADVTSRTKYAAAHLAGKVHDLLDRAGVHLDDKQADKLDKSIAKEIAALTGSTDDAKATLVWLAEHEINRLAEKLAAKAGDDYELTRDDIDEVLAGTTESLTIAGFGRMFANRADLAVDAAVQVAHAFTTHAQQVDLDYFTAVDDLQASFDEPDAEGKVKGAGAGHLDVNEYHSGVFYRYFNVNRDDLTANWGPMQRGETGADVVERVEKFLTALICELPSGRDSTAFHQTDPAYVMVTISPRGTSFAPAFDKPVTVDDSDGHVTPSVERLAAYADQSGRVAPIDARFVFDLNDNSIDTLPDLTSQVARWIVTGDLPQASSQVVA